MNSKHISIIFFILVLMFSISAVCAANETVSDVNQNQDILLSSEEVNDFGSNPDEITPQADNASYNSTATSSVGNYSYGHTNMVANVDNPNLLPVLSVSVNNDEDSILHNYVDVSIEYNNNSVNIDNKNYYFTVSQNDNSIKNAGNHIENTGDHKLMGIFASVKNNNMLLNVNFLNVSNQTLNLADSNNLLSMLWNMIISIFNSIFR